MDRSVQNDADEALRKIYFEYLARHYSNDPVERSRREGQFDNNHPNPRDLSALNNARDAYLSNHGGDAAIEAARDALHTEFHRQEPLKKEVDPNRYAKDGEYHGRMNALIDKVIEARQESRVELTQGAYDRASAQGIALEKEPPPANDRSFSSKINQELDAEEGRGSNDGHESRGQSADASKLNQVLDGEERTEQPGLREVVEATAAEQLRFSKLNQLLDKNEGPERSAPANGHTRNMPDAKREITSRNSHSWGLGL